LVGTFVVAASLLALCAGVGLRASLLGPRAQKVWGSAIAAAILLLALWVATHFSAGLFGIYVSGPIWIGVGVLVCFLFVSKKLLKNN
jgi:hypothetical protein